MDVDTFLIADASKLTLSEELTYCSKINLIGSNKYCRLAYRASLYHIKLNETFFFLFNSL